MTDGTVLVIAHEATLTGSPRVLHGLLSCATGMWRHPVAVRLLAAGPLAPALTSHATAADPDRRPAVAVVNSALAAASVDDLDDSVPVLVYVHEQGRALDELPPAARRVLTDRAARILAVSPGAVDDLVALGVDRRRVALLPPAVTTRPPSTEEVSRIRSELAPDGGPLVVGCGEAGWRKGTDLFLQVAASIRSRHDARFVWVGRRTRSWTRWLDHELRLLGLDAAVTFTGLVPDAVDHLAAGDLLLHTSREDPNPLVPLEAGLLGVPTVGFHVGGVADLARSGAAVTAPYPDVDAVARLAERLLADPVERTGLAARVEDLVHREHRPEALARRLVAEVELLAQEGAHG